MGFFLTIVYICVIFIRPQEFIADIRNWPILDFMSVGCIIFIFLEGGFSAAKFKRSFMSMLLIGFWLALSISNVANGWLGGGWVGFQNFAKVAIVYFLVIFSVDSLPKLKLFLWVMVCMSSFLALQSIVMFFTGAGLVGGDTLHRGAVIQTRGIGIFSDPNDLAINIVPMLAFVLPAFHKGLMSRTWVTSIFFLIPMVTGVAFTRSRGGILGLAAVGWYYFYRRVGILGSMVPVVIMASFLLAIPRMGQLSTKEGSARSRLEHWSYGLELLKANPVFGVGYGRFTENYSHTAHNSFVLIAAEAGFLGAMTWVALFFCAFRDIRFLRLSPRAPPWLDTFLDALTAALLGWLVSGYFLSQTYKPMPYLLMAILVAGMNVLAREGVEVQHPWGARQMLLTFAVTMGAVMFVYISTRVLWVL